MHIHVCPDRSLEGMLGLAGNTDRAKKARLCAPPVSIYERACMYTSLLLDFFLCAQRLLRRVVRGILPAVRNCFLVTIYVVGRSGVPLVLRSVCVCGGGGRCVWALCCVVCVCVCVCVVCVCVCV